MAQESENARPGQGIHHPNFGRHLVNKMDELGIENVFVYTPESKRHNISRELVEFFQKQFDAVKSSESEVSVK